MSQAEKLITKNDAYGTVGVPAAAAAPTARVYMRLTPKTRPPKTRPGQKWMDSFVQIPLQKQTPCGDVCSALLWWPLSSPALLLWRMLQHDLTAA